MATSCLLFNGAVLQSAFLCEETSRSHVYVLPNFLSILPLECYTKAH